MASSSGASSSKKSVNNLGLITPKYVHNTDATLFTSRTEKNSGRRFFRCPFWMSEVHDYGKFVDGDNVGEEEKCRTMEANLKLQVETLEMKNIKRKESCQKLK